MQHLPVSTQTVSTHKVEDGTQADFRIETLSSNPPKGWTQRVLFSVASIFACHTLQKTKTKTNKNQNETINKSRRAECLALLVGIGPAKFFELLRLFLLMALGGFSSLASIS